MAFLVCENLEYLYSMGTPFQTAALDDVSLEIEKGELVGIIGHTGSGRYLSKTTRFRKEP